MKKPIQIINKDFDDYLSIQYAFTNVCNYKCNYCWPESHAGTSRWPNYDIICKNFDHLISIYKTKLNKKTVRFHLLGGEPTLWPKLGDFVKFIHDKHDCRITMSTNGSRTLRWWEEYASHFSDIQISVHHEFADVEHIKKVIDIIYNKNTTMVAAMVLMDPTAWDKCKSMVEKFVEYPAEWMVKTKMLMFVDGDNKNSTREYTEEQLEFLKEKIKRYPTTDYLNRMKELNNIQKTKTNAVICYDDGSVEPYTTFAIFSNKLNSFTGWECELGKSRVSVQADGSIKGTCGEERIFGDNYFNINDENFTEKFTSDLINPVICSMQFCGCSSEIRLNKRQL